MLRKVLACFTMVCCLGMFAGCEPPAAKDGAATPKVENKDAGKPGDKKSSKDKVRKKKPPHVTTAK